MSILGWTGVILGSLFVLAALISMIVITPEKHFSFITLFGKYQKTLNAGFGLKIPFFTSVDERVYIGIEELPVELSLKTQDQVTFSIILKILFQVSDNPDEAYKAVYNLASFKDQLRSISTDAVIPVANGIELEDVYNAKEKITDTAEEALKDFFVEYGITIDRVISDEPRLPVELEEQANAVNVAKREQEAAEYEAKTIKVKKVGEAEADGESVKIRMEKLGEARTEYANATSEAVRALTESGVSPDKAIDFLSNVGDQDALVTASRNGNTIVVSQGGKSDTDMAVLGALKQS